MPLKKKASRGKFILERKAFVLAGAGLLVVLAASELFSLGWGSGTWLGRLSVKWALTIALFYLPLATLLVLLTIGLYAPGRLKRTQKRFLRIRQSLGLWRWALLAPFLIFLPWFVFYSAWGGLFIGLYFRVLLFLIVLGLVAVLLTDHTTQLIEWRSFLLAGLLLGAILVLAESFVLVTDFPFALHWSEGNRLWDYSVSFGSDRFNFAGPEPIFVWIDAGRQTLWGLPFLIPNVPIWLVRFWSALLVTVPYAFLGWAAFKPDDSKREWVAVGLWSLIFLNQGPIYTPLVLAAILVALTRRKPIWLALPLVYLAGHYAGLSRFTWRFAPAIWAVILSFGDSSLARGAIRWRDWLRAFALGLAGIWSKGLPILIGIVLGLSPFLANGNLGPVEPGGSGGSIETLQGLQAVSIHQPFLWERLFPNDIYAPGILFGLAFATVPLILLMINLIQKGHWKTVFWQQVAMVLGLGALLVVGVIASAKVGGGTDLHNMDMFLLGLVLVAAVAWEGGLVNRLNSLIRETATLRWLLAAMILIPAFLPMIEGKPLELPTPERTQFVLARIQNKVMCARQFGEVLFMDQRQLITFGLMGDLPLVDEYEKKYVMDQALSSNSAYFEKFREDLAIGRFALIVTEREALQFKEADLESIGDGLIEENNAWVTWVTTPLLDYYESVSEFKDAAVEMFMPIERDFDCP
ncbi:MAG: hypothetical protein WD740_07965 [Anaerolineales bacterium]